MVASSWSREAALAKTNTGTFFVLVNFDCLVRSTGPDSRNKEEALAGGAGDGQAGVSSPTDNENSWVPPEWQCGMVERSQASEPARPGVAL